MKDIEKLELLKAAMAVAVADHQLRRSEMGVVMGLAARVGLGEASLEAMMTAAKGNPAFADNVLMQSAEHARTAFELLVAEARIDGEISEEEREVLTRLADRLHISGDEFTELYKTGIARADKIRQSRSL